MRRSFFSYILVTFGKQEGDKEMKKSAIILEGGAKRGIFTSGVLDFLMENDYYIPHVIGVSAGSGNAANYLSRQKGRTKACTIRSELEGKMFNIHSVVHQKSLLDLDLIFERDPMELYPFDFDTYFSSDMTCEIVVTNCLNGRAEYLNETKDKKRLMKLFRASCSMPVLTPMVYIDGIPYLDGGLADSIPLIHSMRSGYRKNVVILTRNKGYRKSISKKSMAMYQRVYRDYPELLRTICSRAYQYNKTVSAIEKWEEEGKIFVIRPTVPAISRMENKAEALEAFYRNGYEQMEKQFEAMKEYLEQ